MMTRILIADDDRTTRLLLSETLRAQKFTVVSVADGAAAPLPSNLQLLSPLIAPTLTLT